MRKLLLRAGLLLAVGGASFGGWVLWRRATDPDNPPPPPASVAVADGVYALLVGCTEYPVLEAERGDMYDRVIRLVGPGKDVQLLHDVLRRWLGVPEAHITVLSGWPDDPKARPTRENILGALERLAREVPAGARVIFTYAGHGTQQPDDEDPARRDEADEREEVVLAADAGLWDAELGGVPGAIRDDELRTHLVAIRDAGATVWAVFDCCHSGSMMRGAGDREDPDLGEVRMRRLDPHVLGIPEMPEGGAPATRGDAGAEEPDGLLDGGGVSLRGIAAFYGAHSWEQAPEMTLPRSRWARGRERHGLLTFLVARTLQRLGGNVTLGELFEHVRDEYRALPWTEATPVPEGDLALRAVPGAADAGDVFFLRRRGPDLVADAGALRGLEAGSVLDVWRPGGLGDEDARLGQLVVTRAEATLSVLGALDGGLDPADVPDHAPARPVAVAAGQAALRLAAAPASRALGAVPDLPPLGRFAWTAPADADWLLRPLPVDASGEPRFELVPTRPDDGFGALEVAAPGLLDLLDRLDRAARLRAWCREGAMAGLPEGVTVEAELLRFGAARSEPLRPDTQAAPGDRLLLRVVNGSHRDVDVAVTSVDALQRESHLWPTGEASRRITSEETDPVSLPRFQLVDDGDGRESMIVVVGVREHGEAPLEVQRVGGHASAEEAARAAEDARALWRALLGEEVATRGDGAAPARVGLLDVTWRTGWGPIALPDARRAEAVRLPEPVDLPGAEGTPSPPTARARRITRALVLPGDRARADVLVLLADGPGGAPGAALLYVDEDGDAELGTATPAEAARRAAAGDLPAELLLLLDGPMRAAAYPRVRGDRALGRVLVEGAEPGRAGERLERTPAGWAAQVASGPWLTSVFVPFEEANAGRRRLRIVNALRRALADP